MKATENDSIGIFVYQNRLKSVSYLTTPRPEWQVGPKEWEIERFGKSTFDHDKTE